MAERARLVRERDGAVLADLEIADTPATRMRGLLGRDGLAPATGLLIRPCSSVHTWGMRFAIDVVFLDRRGLVLRVVPALPPRRLAWGGWRAKDTLEMAAGEALKLGLVVGDRVVVLPGAPAGGVRGLNTSPSSGPLTG